MINVFDIKNFVYCPRIIYWYYCAPVKTHESYKMQWGKEKHETEKNKELRRTLQRYNLEQAEYFFEHPIANERLSGKIDLMLISEGVYIPVEYKFTRATKSFAHKVQVYGYALLIEDVYKAKVTQGYIYYPRHKEVEEVKITDSHIQKVCDIINNIDKTVEESVLPDVEFNENKCGACEFMLFCNDTI